MFSTLQRSPHRSRDMPFECHAPSGDRVAVGGATSESTVRDLIDALAVDHEPPRPNEARLLVDGRVVDDREHLDEIGLHHGSALEWESAETRVVDAADAVLEVVWIAGPDAGVAFGLPVGTHRVGRSSLASVRCADPALELHHAQFVVAGDGTAVVTQLCGRQSIEIDGVLAHGATPVYCGQRIGIGHSLLEVRRVGASSVPPACTSPLDGDPWRMQFVRTTRSIATCSTTTLAAPRRERAAGATGGGLVPTILAVAGAGAIALLLHQLMFLLFGLMGALVAVGTWVTQRTGATRSRRAAVREHERAMADFADALRTQRRSAKCVHLEITPRIDRALTMMHACSSTLWGVRAGDPDHTMVSIGIGDGSWAPSVTGLDADTPPEVWSLIESAARLIDVPVQASLGADTVTAIVGDAAIAAAVARSMVMQLVASSGPADWQLAVVAERALEWECVAWLAHAADAHGATRMVAPADVSDLVAQIDANDTRHLLVVVDRADLLAARTSALRRLMAGNRSVAVIVLCASVTEIPAATTSSLVLGPQGGARWSRDTRLSVLPEPVRVAGISAQQANRVAAAIAYLIDPEVNDDAATLPREVGLMELLDRYLGDGEDGMPLESAALAQRLASSWRSNGSDPPPCAPVGMAADGVVEIDLVGDGPHALVAGTTGSGKSELLRTLLVGLAARLSPDHINFVLVDYKGGSTFDVCEGLPHVVGVVTDLDDRLAARALRSLEAELTRRERCLREAGAADLSGYRLTRQPETPPIPRLVVVIDEFASLMSQQPEFIGALLGIAQRGRSLGVHLILATQRPQGVISDDIRANTNLRIALRVQDSADSSDVIGDPAAALLPRHIAGRVIMRLGSDEYVSFQAARCTRPIERPSGGGLVVEWLRRSTRAPENCPADREPVMTEVELLVMAIREATSIVGCALPHRPWLPELSSDIDDSVVAPDALGVVDEPDHQRQVPLRWDPSAGNLLVVGATGMGCTSALLTVGSMLLERPSLVELYVIDALGDTRLRMLEQHERCAAVVRVHERERLMRLLEAVDNARCTRKAYGHSAVAGRTDIVLMIDGLGALRSELEQHDQFSQLAQLDKIVADGPSLGIVVVCATHQPGGVPSQMLGQIAHRWVMHLADPLDASMLGVPASLVPAATPGRLIVAGSCREAQLIAFVPDRLSFYTEREHHQGFVSSLVRELPDRVAIGELPGGADDDGNVVLPIAMSYATMQPSVMPVAHGEHVLVIGPSRSGRTTTLAAVAHAWHHAVPHGWTASVTPRRSSARLGRVFTCVAALLDEMPLDNRALIVIDDAELVEDPDGRLATLIANRRDGITVIAAGRPDALRTSYGHWTAAVRRSRLGVVLASCTDIDGDLLNVSLPRHLPIAPRPGLAWIVADGETHLAQVALPPPSCVGT